MAATVGGYLVQRLEELGLKHVFGVPGDYCMSFMDVVVDSKMELVCNTHELAGGYAADGYARIHGLGAEIVTFNVGGFSAYNAVGGAFTESVPLVLISGAPTVAQRRGLEKMHHLVEDYDHQLTIYKKITVDAILLDDAAQAPALIDRALTRCIQHKKPVYIEIPTDMVAAPCASPQGKLETTALKSHAEALSQCVAEAAALLKAAKSPVIVVGFEVARFDMQRELLELLNDTAFPVAVTMDGLSLVPLDLSTYLGAYRGALGTPQAREAVEKADRILFIGTLRHDISSGNFTDHIDRARAIVSHAASVSIGYHEYPNVRMNDFIPALRAALGRGTTAPTRKGGSKDAFAPDAAAPITSDRLFARLRNVIGAGTIVVSDTGDALFQSSALPHLDRYITQSYYLSIGYALPAAMGVALAAPQARTWIFVGDGAFQVTAQELSTIVHRRIPMVIVLLNNDGYVIERLLHHDAPYNDLNRWRYADLPQVFGDCASMRVETEGDVETALDMIATTLDKTIFLEIVLARNDCSHALREVAATAQIGD